MGGNSNKFGTSGHKVSEKMLYRKQRNTKSQGQHEGNSSGSSLLDFEIFHEICY